MSKAELLSEFILDDMKVSFVRGLHGQVGLVLLPASVLSWSIDAEDVESLLQIATMGSAASGGFAAGHTLRNSAAVEDLKYRGHSCHGGAGILSIVTKFESSEGLEIRQVIRFHRGQRAFRLRTEVKNQGNRALSLDLLASFSLCGLSAFSQGDAAETLTIHRIRSVWSAEGRVTSETAEDLQLETSWSKHGVRTERFGQTGSLPVRKFFPFIAVESAHEGVVWAAQVACPSSWQIELYRRSRALSLSGGLADFEFGHWRKALMPGDEFETPWALLTVVKGDLDTASQRLLDLHQEAFDHLRAKTIGPVFNEFCTTWGEPSHEKILKMIDAVKGRGLEYFVIDAGWYADPVNGWEKSHGDWTVNEDLFPKGLEETVEAIRAAGMEPGIWFELETCGERSRAFSQTDHLLHRDGFPVTSGFRRFWDMSDPWVLDFLTQHVIEFVRKYQFRYLKIDYNESVGMGCDGAESRGEALRQKVAASQEFFRKIRKMIPGVVIENCASGGHRLEPSMMALADVASFSDAHECLEIPVIAANLHRVILPCQSLVWAVLRQTDTLQRIAYSLSATFLGVPCLSGDVHGLDNQQWKFVEEGLAFYKTLEGAVERGTSALFGPPQKSLSHPQGWQAVLRTAQSGTNAFAVVHTFSGEVPDFIALPLGPGWAVGSVFSAHSSSVVIEDGVLNVRRLSAFDAVAVRLLRS